MKLGLVGKGGVGKSTVAALLARAWSERGRRVVAVDTDSNPGLGLSLGLSPEQCEALPALPRLPVAEGATRLTAGDLLGQYGVGTPAGVTLLTAMRVEHAGGGSTCASHATVRHFLGEALEDVAGVDVTVVDMEPGLEHLSRVGGTLGPVDVVLVVMEPNEASLVTATRAIALAHQLGIPRVHGLGNKARGVEDEGFFSEAADSRVIPMVGTLPYDPSIAEAERTGGPTAPSPALQMAIDHVVDRLEWITARSRSRDTPGRPSQRRPERT